MKLPKDEKELIDWIESREGLSRSKITIEIKENIETPSSGFYRPFKICVLYPNGSKMALERESYMERGAGTIAVTYCNPEGIWSYNDPSIYENASNDIIEDVSELSSLLLWPLNNH